MKVSMYGIMEDKQRPSNIGFCAIVSAYDKPLVEKLQMVEHPEEGAKKFVLSIIDSLFARKKLKDTLSNTLSLAQ